MLSYIGQHIFDTCIKIEAYLPSSIDAHENTGFELIPKDAKLFTERLLEVISPFMSEELMNASDFDALDDFETGQAAWSLLDAPESTIYFPELVEHAKEILKVGGNDEEMADEDV